VLVDDELIYAFYDQQLPPDVCSGHSFEALVPRRAKSNPNCSSSPATS
jgi:ATP-dependent helicase HrpA